MQKYYGTKNQRNAFLSCDVLSSLGLCNMVIPWIVTRTIASDKHRKLERQVDSDDFLEVESADYSCSPSFHRTR